VTGLLIAAAEEERFTRKKHDYEFPSTPSTSACARLASRRDVDYVVFFEKPFVKFERLLIAGLATFRARTRSSARR